VDPTSVLIDTSLFIEHIRARDKTFTVLMRIHDRRNLLATSSIVAAELWFGARSPLMRAEVAKVLSAVQVIPFTSEAAFQISLEAERLKVRNAMIGFRDLAIACVALLEGLPLATHNRAEFERVAGLTLFELGATA
jgi:predicted nucleic acid-binding protein